MTLKSAPGLRIVRWYISIMIDWQCSILNHHIAVFIFQFILMPSAFAQIRKFKNIFLINMNFGVPTMCLALW